MKKRILFVLLLNFTLTAPILSQSDDWKSTIITSEGDTLKGKVDNMYPTFYENSIRLKIIGRNTFFFKEFEPKEIESITSDKGFIRSETIDGEKIFIKVEVAGDCNLYKTYAENTMEPSFFVKKGQGDFLALEKGMHREQLGKLLKNDEVSSYIEKKGSRLGYNTADLSKIIARYNFKENISEIPEDQVQEPTDEFKKRSASELQAFRSATKEEYLKPYKPVYKPNRLPNFTNTINAKLGVAINAMSGNLLGSGSLGTIHRVKVSPEIFLKLQSERRFNYTAGFFQTKYTYDEIIIFAETEFPRNFTPQENVFWLNNTLDYKISGKHRALLGVMLGIYTENYTTGQTGAKMSYYIGHQYMAARWLFVNLESHIAPNTADIAINKGAVFNFFPFEQPKMLNMEKVNIFFNLKVGLLLF